MSKKETFERIIAYEVRKALSETYSIHQLTSKQEELVKNVSNRIYTLFGDSMTVKDLQEKSDEVARPL